MLRAITEIRHKQPCNEGIHNTVDGSYTMFSPRGFGFALMPPDNLGALRVAVARPGESPNVPVPNKI